MSARCSERKSSWRVLSLRTISPAIQVQSKSVVRSEISWSLSCGPACWNGADPQV